MNYNVVENEELLATIVGSNSIEADLEQIYDNLEYCPDSFREWVEGVTLEPVCEALSMADALNAEAEDEAPTWEEWLKERFPLPSDRKLTMGRINHELFGCGDCNRVQAHSPDFWQHLRQNNDENLWSEGGTHPDDITVLDFVELCTIEWYDPFVI
jgi:hypothetical protein